MSEKLSINKILNPRGIKHPVAKGLLLGAGTAYAAGIVVSGWLHRSTHGGVEYGPKAKRAWRGANLMLTGMPKFDWADHLAHHAFPDRHDKKAQDAWNNYRPKGAPEAPDEAYRDPYSVVLEGYKRVLFNTSGLHRRAKKAIGPFLHSLNSFDQQTGNADRKHWPAHFRRIDMDEGDPTAFRNRYPYLGLVALGIGEAVTLGPAVALPAMSVHLVGLLGMGGDINAVNHTGQTKGFMNRLRVLTGRDQPIPDENGEFAANLMPGFEALVMGEQHHQFHHQHPENPFIAGASLNRDPVGLVIKSLVALGQATTPGAEMS
jgi:hypothetical protein